MKKILYLSDLSYQAKGRNYGEEDIFITSRLKEAFDVALCHPGCAEGFEDAVYLIVFRNTGSVIGYKDVYQEFVKRVKKKPLNTFNSFDGKADMKGKEYLLALTKEQYPVIPTIDSKEELYLLPDTDAYVIKPKDGADSIGLEFLTMAELDGRDIADRSMLIQPKIDFVYEVSFYFINDRFEYALYAPDQTKRWRLEPYSCSEEDIAFAERFIEWNSVTNGIQRVDACRTVDGRLLLVELEDLNPYLSLSETDETTREGFIRDFIQALEKAME